MYEATGETKTMTRKAWHFLYDDWRTGYDRLLVKVGEKLTYSGEMPPVLMKRGLHASTRLIDALGHANGAVVTAVECAGTIVEQPNDDKFVCTERTALWGYDASDELRLFARRIAKEALEKYYPDFEKLDPVIMKWLETGDETLRGAAWSAADSAARSAAGSAAWSAARSAARSAAWSAADSAAWSAADSAARSAANELLTSIVIEGAKKRGLL